MLGWVMGLGLVAVVSVALPSDGVEIRWQAPQECPDAVAVQARVERLLGKPLAEVEDQAVVEADAVVRARAEGGYDVALTTRSRTGERGRSLSSADCEVLADTVALVIAIAIDPRVVPMGDSGQQEALEEQAAAEVQEPPQEDVPPEPVVSEPEPAPPSNAPEARPVDPAARPAVRAAVRAAAAAGVGLLPGLAPGVDAAVSLLRGRLRVELGFAWWFERMVALVGAEGRAGLRAWSMDARGCFVPSVSVVEFPLCGGVEAGLMRGRGLGIDEPARTNIPWVAVDLGPSIVFGPRRFIGLWLGVDLVVPVTRPTFAVDGERTTHRPAPVAGTAVLGVEGRFP